MLFFSKTQVLLIAKLDLELDLLDGRFYLLNLGRITII